MAQMTSYCKKMKIENTFRVDYKLLKKTNFLLSRKYNIQSLQRIIIKMCATLLNQFLILLIICFGNWCLADLKLEVNDACATQHYQGTCISTSKCSHISEFMDNLGLKSTDVMSCGYDIKEEVICCPPEKSLVRSANRPAEHACEKIESRLITHGIIYDSRAQRRYPYMAYIVYNVTGHICGGTVIHKNFILTAAHCLDLPEAMPTKVILGVSNLKRFEDEGIEVDVKNIHIYQNYSAFTKYDDIGLIELVEYDDFQGKVNPACLYTEPTELFNDTELTVTGWGSTEKDLHSTQLMMTKLMYIPLSQCNASYASYIDRRIPRGILDSQLCAYAPGRDICGGDSGGGVVIIDNDKYKVVGIVSASINCGANLPSLHTRVAKYLDYIESIIWPNGYV